MYNAAGGGVYNAWLMCSFLATRLRAKRGHINHAEGDVAEHLYPRRPILPGYPGMDVPRGDLS